MRLTLVALSTLFISMVAFSATIYVPDNYATIQEAIDASVHGDEIIVRSGAYVENIDFRGKAISVKSEQGASVTTIDGNQSGSVVVFQNGEANDTVLDGFTITNGDGHGFYPQGGGIHCAQSSPTITNSDIVKRGTVIGPLQSPESSPRSSGARGEARLDRGSLRSLKRCG